MKKRSIGRISNLFLILIVVTLFVSLTAEEELRPYKLINADKLTITKVEEEFITNLVGNVHLFYGETEFFSDKAEIFELKQFVQMQGNVEVYDDTLSLYSDTVKYYRKEERLYLQGNVLAKESHIDSTFRTFEAEEVEYLRNSREFFAKENVITHDERENMYGTCGELKYFMNDGYGYLLKEPILSIIKEDTLTISAEKIEYFKNYKKVVATFNVKTFSSDFLMSSDFLLYFADDEKAVYLGEPEFTSNLADATAVEFRIIFEEQKIKWAILQDSCSVFFSESENQPKQNWAVGDQMEFIFEKGNITVCEAKGNVTSYFQQEKNIGKDYTANKSNGEHLIIELDGNKIIRISLKDNVDGIYKFNNNSKNLN